MEKYLIISRRGIMIDKKKHYGLVIGFGLALAIAVVVGIGIHSVFMNKEETGSKTTKLGFEDIGELATQEAYCTVVNSYDKSRKLAGLDIPFTNSKCVYSYDVIIKAGFDFSKIKHKTNDEKQIIKVHMPQPRLLSCEINTDSFKVYYEDESVFKPITWKETNDGLIELQKSAKKSALDNGILEHASANAETILRGFFSSKEYKDYEIVFDYEKEKEDKNEEEN